MDYKISFYIPAFNAEKTIKDAINSILNQSIKVDELIIINDNSTDNTEKIINEFNKIKLINNSKNMGLGFNRNLAIHLSKNDIIGAIDADVVLEKNWLENLLTFIGKNNIVMCGGNMMEKVIDNKCNLWRAKYYSQNWGNMDKKDPPFLFGCNTLLLKSAWKKIGGYSDELKTNGEDINFAEKLKYHDNFKMYYSSNAHCLHLQNDNLKTLSKRVWRYHSFGYKIKNPSFFRLFKLILKQLKFFFKRLIKDLIQLNLTFVFINTYIFIKFIVYEFSYLLTEKYK